MTWKAAYDILHLEKLAKWHFLDGLSNNILRMKKIFLLGVVIVLGVGMFMFKKGDNDSQTVLLDSEDAGSLFIKGSDTEVQLVSNLVEAFLAERRSADIAVTGGGSGAGIASLLNGEIDIANSSRAMEAEELGQADAKGLEAGEFILARDGLSVIVHADNPITALSLDDVSRIFRGAVTNWRELGGPDASVVLYGRQSTSGTYLYFRDAVVRDDYAPTMRNMEGSQAIVDSVRSDKNGIGYVGVGYAKNEDGTPRADINIILIKPESAAEAVSPLDVAAIREGRYPITRPIYQYTARLPKPGTLLREFLTFENSDEGQRIVEKTGFYRITAEDAAKNAALFAAAE